MSEENVPSAATEQDPAPVGTWALLCIVAVAMTAAWLFLYFGVFIPRGTVN